MAKTRTWWGQRFIGAVERFTDPGRLGRGRAYATNGKILSWELRPGQAVATVRGSVNPYFGVYKEPRYSVVIKVGAIEARAWGAIVGQIGASASLVTRLLLNEMPEAIELPFEAAGHHLLPHPTARPKATCSCPDSANPCKHIAGLYYLLARELDRDPFLMFELRGLTREALKAELLKTPLGAALAAGLVAADSPPTPDTSLFPLVTAAPVTGPVDPRLFWQGHQPTLQALEPIAPPTVPALLIKREGDFPPFWTRDSSFIEVMEELYARVRKASI